MCSILRVLESTGGIDRQKYDNGFACRLIDANVMDIKRPDRVIYLVFINLFSICAVGFIFTEPTDRWAFSFE